MLRLKHVCVRWSLSVCVGCVCVREREILRDRVRLYATLLFGHVLNLLHRDISIMVFTLASDWPC